MVFLHIGAPKSGTTYVQSRLIAAPAAAADQGLLWVVPWSRQVEAAREVKNLRPGASLSTSGPWATLAYEARRWHGHAALVSMEWLMNAEDHQVAAALSALSPARVEVVCTARDLVRAVPGAWQEAMQNYRTWPWHEYIEEVTAEGVSSHPGAVEVWGQQDIPPVLRRWGAHVGLDHVHLVTVPPRGADPGVLWDRFCRVVGLDGSAFPEPRGGNPSLGAVSATLMLHLNQVLKERRFSHPDYIRYAKHLLAKDVLAPARRSEEPIALSQAAHAALVRRSEQMVEELEALPVHLEGDLSELLPEAEPRAGCDPSEVTEAEMFEAALEGLAGTMRSMSSHEQRLLRRLEQLERERQSGRVAARTLQRALARRTASLWGQAVTSRLGTRRGVPSDTSGAPTRP